MQSLIDTFIFHFFRKIFKPIRKTTPTKKHKGSCRKTTGHCKVWKITLPTIKGKIVKDRVIMLNNTKEEKTSRKTLKTQYLG
jgi:hypothetical protein